MSASDQSRFPEDEQITSEFPVVEGPRVRDSSILWVAAGILIGIIVLTILFALGGGSEDAGDRPPSQPESTSALPSGTHDPPPDGGRTTPGPVQVNSAALVIRAQDGERVFIEVRRGGASGRRLFAGVITDTGVREFAIPAEQPLWLQVAWAPSALVQVGGVEQDTSGGTESYLVTRAGLQRVATGDQTG